MWKEGTWCHSVQDVLSPVSMKKKPKKTCRSKKNQDVQEEASVSDPPNPGNVEMSCPVLALVEDEESVKVDDDWTKHALSVADATDAAAAAAAEAAEQTRRALLALKGPVRLKSHVGGASAKHQTSNALKYIRTRLRVQSEVRLRRVRMSQENLALQRQLLLAKGLENLKAGDEWDNSLLSKEQIQAISLEKYEAVMRRERSLAYSYTHQPMQNKATKSTKFPFTSQSNPLSGWIWLDRCMTAAQPWETHTISGKDHNTDPSASLRIPAGDISKCLACLLLNQNNPSAATTEKPQWHHSPAASYSKTGSSSSSRKFMSASHNGCIVSQDNDSRNTLSSLSERFRRHTITGSLARKDESLTSPLLIPSYMAPTHSAKAKSKPPRTLGMESSDMHEKVSTWPAKKRLSYPPASATTRRHIGPSLLNTGSVAKGTLSGSTSVSAKNEGSG